jgi:hypothetical protein
MVGAPADVASLPMTAGSSGRQLLAAPSNLMAYMSSAADVLLTAAPVNGDRKNGSAYGGFVATARHMGSNIKSYGLELQVSELQACAWIQVRITVFFVQNMSCTSYHAVQHQANLLSRTGAYSR